MNQSLKKKSSGGLGDGSAVKTTHCSCRGPKIKQAIVTALGYPLKLDGKALLLKSPHTLVIGHGEIKWVMAKNLCFDSTGQCCGGCWGKEAINGLTHL